ncbi:hypothetical protein SRHO_G00133670 [Serrasalmus rhombeus]
MFLRSTPTTFSLFYTKQHRHLFRNYVMDWITRILDAKKKSHLYLACCHMLRLMYSPAPWDMSSAFISNENPPGLCKSCWIPVQMQQV